MSIKETKNLVMNILVIIVYIAIAYIGMLFIGLVFVMAETVEQGDNTSQPTIVIEKPFDDSLVEAFEPDPISDDTYLLAQIINAEAGNQPYEGKLAVGNVIMNRIDSPKFPDTIKDVIFQKGQFSPVSDGSINNVPSDVAIQAAQEVINGTEVLADNVLFFYNPSISTSRWIFTRPVVTQIGHHRFAI